MGSTRCVRLVCGLILVLPLVVACSNSGSVTTAKVRGKVTYQGNPVPGAVISFAPQAEAGAAGSRGATGTTDAEGKFTLTTYKAGDGATVGKHYVTVGSEDANKPLPGQTPPNLLLEVKPGGNDLAIELVP
ncbi:MAG: hypothetical protein NTY19_27460 [Planctomycetota bacterium]|nr:hypothetical protein [Planctomycetota bacterium]